MKMIFRMAPLAVTVVMAACSSTLNRDQEEALNQAAHVEVVSTDDGVAVRLPETALFEFNKSDLRGDAVGVMDRSVVLVNRSKKPIQIDGYTDNVGTREYNEALSVQRADTVSRALTSRGVDPARVTAVGHGFDNPVASNDTPEGRALNRRTEIVVKGETMDTLMGPKE